MQLECHDQVVLTVVIVKGDENACLAEQIPFLTAVLRAEENIKS